MGAGKIASVNRSKLLQLDYSDLLHFWNLPIDRSTEAVLGCESICSAPDIGVQTLKNIWSNPTLLSFQSIYICTPMALDLNFSQS